MGNCPWWTCRCLTMATFSLGYEIRPWLLKRCNYRAAFVRHNCLCWDEAFSLLARSSDFSEGPRQTDWGENQRWDFYYCLVTLSLHKGVTLALQGAYKQVGRQTTAPLFYGTGGGRLPWFERAEKDTSGIFESPLSQWDYLSNFHFSFNCLVFKTCRRYIDLLLKSWT